MYYPSSTSRKTILTSLKIKPTSPPQKQWQQQKYHKYTESSKHKLLTGFLKYKVYRQNGSIKIYIVPNKTVTKLK